MALQDQLNATTAVYWESVVPEDIFNTASALLWALCGKAKAEDSLIVQPEELVDGGSMIKVPLINANSNHGTYGATTVINQSKKDLVTAARFGWGGAYGSNTLNLDDKIKNSGAEAVIRLTNQYMENIKESARVDLAAQVLSTKGTGDGINGLLDLFNITAAGVVGATSVEYGCIARSEEANWINNVIVTAETMCFETMQGIFRAPAAGDVASKKPNFCCTTEVLKDAYELSLHPQQRYTNTAMVQAGWSNITHKDAPIVSDGGVPTGWLFALNLNYLGLKAHKDFNFTTPVWLDKAVLGQPDVISANTRWQGNLICKNRKMHVLHVNLSKAA